MWDKCSIIEYETHHPGRAGFSFRTTSQRAAAPGSAVGARADLHGTPALRAPRAAALRAGRRRGDRAPAPTGLSPAEATQASASATRHTPARAANRALAPPVAYIRLVCKERASCRAEAAARTVAALRPRRSAAPAVRGAPGEHQHRL